MKSFFQKVNFWWFATMTPSYGLLTTISQRETLRKRRLLSIMVASTLLALILSTAAGIFIGSTPQIVVSFLEACLFLLTLWLNRRGYLQRASVLLFLNEGGSILLATHTFSLSNPISLLWTLSPMALLLVTSGLFLSAWVVVLMGAFETLVILWYLLIERYTLLISLLPSQEYWNFLIYLILVIFISTMIGTFYTVTTQKALIQADRATELEQAYSKLEVAHRTIQKQALKDALTGLPNHRAVMDQLSKELDRTRRYGRPFSLLFFDADHFKRVNDSHGHAAGDAVLCQIGKRTSGVIRIGDTLGRFGGEEFVLLLPETDTCEASLIAERIRTAIASEPMVTSQVDENIAMTVSIGLSTYPTDGDSEQDLLSQADEAMYIAKRLGRNQVRTADEARQMGEDEELMMLLQQDEQHETTQREGKTPEQLRESYTVRIISSLLSLLERRNQDMSAHAHAVSDLATTIAQMMGLSPKEVSRLGMAALLHDVGKIGIPDRLLQNAHLLSPHEHVQLREHAELGARILEACPSLYDLAPAVLHHHEHWDGSGYPDHLRGEDIPQAARVIAVAEAFDVMQRGHPYQAIPTLAEIMAVLRRKAGTQFDPTIVQALQEVLISQQKQHSLQIIG
jgi:diguanylate cyclase (GGDEF)-like protein